jgi:hypothetical protein
MGIPQGLFQFLLELSELSIRHNHLTVIHPTTFEHNQKLVRLWLYSNEILAIANGSFDGLELLVYLSLFDNSCVDSGFGDFSKNVTVDFSELSKGLKKCYSNYQSTVKNGDGYWKRILALVLTAIATILSVFGTCLASKYIWRLRKLSMEMETLIELENKKRESFHYYSKPDDLDEIAQWQNSEL